MGPPARSVQSRLECAELARGLAGVKGDRQRPWSSASALIHEDVHAVDRAGAIALEQEVVKSRLSIGSRTSIAKVQDEEVDGR